MTNARLAVLAAVALLPALAPLSATAAPAPQPPLVAPPGALARSERLAALIPTPGPIRLQGDDGRATIPFSLSARVDPTVATLHLELSNSQALLAPRSQLVIRLNDAVVAQIALKPGSPNTVADIDLPVELLRGGGNTLQFQAAQHYTNDCENPGAAELWSQIDTDRSRLAITGKPVDTAPHLSVLQDLISPGYFGGRRFTLLTPPAAQASDGIIATGALLAQALGIRLNYQAAQIAMAPAAPGPANDMLRLAEPPAAPGQPAGEPADVVLFGTKAALAPVLGPALAAAITNGFLGLYPMPADPRRLVLLVSGTTDEEVARAATALGIANFPFVDAPQQTVEAIDLVAKETFLPHNQLAEGATATFSDLGFPTVTIRGPDGKAALNFVMPADLYTPDSAEAVLSLDFAYGAGIRGDSVVNLVLNGQFLQALSLNDPAGAVFRGYRLRIPARKLRPGPNTLQFEAVMIPRLSAACTPPDSRTMILSLQDTSTITLPGGDRLAAQPDLGLFSSTGFPYIGGPGFDVAIAARDPNTVAAGWTVLARLAQIAGRPLHEGHVVVGAPAADRPALVIGAANDLPPPLLDGSPVGLQTLASYPYAAAKGIEPQPGSWFQDLKQAIGLSARTDGATALPDAAAPPASRIRGSRDLGRNGLLTAFQAASGGGRTVTILTAETPASPWAATQSLVSPAVWYQLGKDVTLWRPTAADGEVTATQRVGPTYHVGTRSTLYAARYYVGEYPAAWIGLVVAAVLFLSFSLRLFLIRRRRRRFPGSEEGVP